VELQRKRLLTGGTCPPGPRLYLGPFGPGFLNSSAGQSGVALPRPVSGISLPMGVNLRATERGEAAPPWNRLEDAAVREVAGRYGLNWQVASLYVGRASEGGALARERRRSARQCLERWQELARGDGALQRAVRERGEHCRVEETGEMLEENMRNHDRTEHEFAGAGTGRAVGALRGRTVRLPQVRHGQEEEPSRYSRVPGRGRHPRHAPRQPLLHRRLGRRGAGEGRGAEEGDGGGGGAVAAAAAGNFQAEGEGGGGGGGEGRGGGTGEGEGEERAAAEGEGRSGSVGESKGGGGGSASSNGDAAGGGAAAAAAAAAVPATPRQQTKEQLADAQAAQSSVLVAARDAAMQLACDERERSSLAAQYDKDNVVYTKKDWGKKIWRMEE